MINKKLQEWKKNSLDKFAVELIEDCGEVFGDFKPDNQHIRLTIVQFTKYKTELELLIKFGRDFVSIVQKKIDEIYEPINL